MAIDYTSVPLTEKLRKVARYSRLYGVSRTLQKVRGQAHMRLVGDPLPARWANPRVSRRGSHDVAIIGCGNFAYSTIAHYCAQAARGFLAGCYDVVGARAVSLCTRYNGRFAAADPDELIYDSAVRLVFIASNHASHAEFAIRALNAGKSVHIEKPHVVTPSQLDRLVAAMTRPGAGKVFLGFNRPRSPHFRMVQQWIDAERGPLMINWFVAGHEIPEGHWYFSEEEGGRILGNLCHWTDLTLRMVAGNSDTPIRVIPGTYHTSKSDFVLTFDFPDGSVAAITFSAKGHTFEGVREYLNVHRGNALISMRDFEISTLDLGPHRQVFRTRFREHGHAANVFNSVRSGEAASLETVVNSARLFLAAREAAETKQVVEVLPFASAGSVT